MPRCYGRVRVPGLAGRLEGPGGGRNGIQVNLVAVGWRGAICANHWVRESASSPNAAMTSATNWPLGFSGQARRANRERDAAGTRDSASQHFSRMRRLVWPAGGAGGWAARPVIRKPLYLPPPLYWIRGSMTAGPGSILIQCFLGPGPESHLFPSLCRADHPVGAVVAQQQHLPHPASSFRLSPDARRWAAVAAKEKKKPRALAGRT